MNTPNNLEYRIAEIEARNTRVENDKAWETSKTRLVLIFIITYIVAGIWLFTIGETSVTLKALVPALGWFLSTLSIPKAKEWWIKKR